MELCFFILGVLFSKLHMCCSIGVGVKGDGGGMRHRLSVFHLMIMYLFCYVLEDP